MNAEERRENFRNWIVVLGASLGAFMAMLDLAISNSSMTNIQASLSATVDETSWISAAYIIGEIITIPLTAWLTSIFSMRRYLVSNAVLFIIFSTTCGFATSLPQMIVSRFLQGLTGGALIPSAATLVLTLLPLSQRPMGLSVLVLTIAFAPSVGPAFGGWITEVLSWQASYYINIIPGIIVVSTLLMFLKPAPTKLALLKKGDWLGILAMCIGLASVIYVLEEGNSKDWLSDPTIRTFAIIGLVASVLFLLLEMKSKSPFLDLRLYSNGNFLKSNIVSFCYGMVLLGNAYLIPRYVQQVQGYSPLLSGETAMWTGLPQLFIIPIVPFLMKKVDAKILVFIGFVLFGVSSFLNSGMSFGTARDQLIPLQMIRAVAIAMTSAPLTALVFEGIDVAKIGYANALYTMGRNLGGSVCIALTSTFLEKRYRFHFSRITESVSIFDLDHREAMRQFLNALPAQTADTDAFTTASIFNVIHRESLVMAYSDCYFFFMCLMVVGAVTILFMASPKGKTPARPDAH